MQLYMGNTNVKINFKFNIFVLRSSADTKTEIYGLNEDVLAF